MENMIDIINKFTNLIEAIFSEFTNKTFKMLMSLGMFLLAGIFILIGFIIFEFGIYSAFKMLMPEYLAAFAGAVLNFLVAGGLLLWVRRKMS